MSQSSVSTSHNAWESDSYLSPPMVGVMLCEYVDEPYSMSPQSRFY